MTDASGTLAETAVLAQWIAGLRLDDIPDSARTAARACILDSLGCAIAGIHTAPCAMMLELLAEHAASGGSSVPGTGQRLSVLKAGYVIAQAANALDFDDSFRGGAPGHPGATVIPPALAVADWRDSPGADFLRAVVAGYEASLRIGRAIQPSPERERQVFGYATWQSFGAASAAAVLLGLDHVQILDAFGITALHSTLPGGRKGGFGEADPVPWLKNNYGGASEAGIWAALLAARGYRGHRRILEGESGFWIMAASDRYAPELVTEALGRRWLVGQVGFKPYACCRWTHTMIDAIRECLPMVGDSGIAGVTVAGFRELAEMGKGFPETVIDAQFHAPYLAALELAGKSAANGLFEADLHDPRIRALADRVTLVHDREADEGFYKAAALPVKLTIRLDDGRILEAARLYPRGSASTGGFSQQELERKFLQLAEPRIGRGNAEQAIALVARIETADMRDLLALTAVG